jgi:hypothetical protein
MTRLTGPALRRHATYIIAARRLYTRRMAILIWQRRLL